MFGLVWITGSGNAAMATRLTELERSLPEGVEVVTTYDRSSLIDRAIENLTSKLIEEFMVLANVAAAEELESGEKVVYIGAGNFAVVQFRDRNENAFTVKRRISWENEKEKDKREWRKALSQRVQML